MQVTLLGTGLPFPNPHRRGPAYLVEAGEEKIQIDCGSGCVHRLYEAGSRPQEIDHLFITHLHSDHYIDLGHFVIMRWVLGDDRPLHVYGSPGLRKMVDLLLEMHAPDIELRMITRTKKREQPNIVVHELEEGRALETANGLTATAFKVDHYPLEMPFGFRFDTRDKSAAFSGDTCPSENLIKHTRGVDILVHECTEYTKWTNPEIDESHKVKTHTHPDLLGLVARDVRPGLLVASHLMPRSVPKELRRMIGANYDGPTVVGEDLMTG